MSQSRDITEIDLYHIDAFADRPFTGNPAAVCFLPRWLDDRLLQSIAAENNLSETAFLVEGEGLSELRWFTPSMEVDLCGHATLASAHAIFSRHEDIESVSFQTKSGQLKVAREGDLLSMDFPARPAEPCASPEGLAEILGAAPSEVLRARDLLAVYDKEEDISNMSPDFSRLASLDVFAVIVTAPGSDCDFVSRFFAPAVGIDEDPVTGSAHCTLVPYWARRLGRNELHARQLSARGGELFCVDRGERVSIAGRAVTYLSGRMRVPDGD